MLGKKQNTMKFYSYASSMCGMFGLDNSVNQFQLNKLIPVAAIVIVLFVVIVVLLNKTNSKKANNHNTKSQGVNL
jgi:hypothetical protein